MIERQRAQYQALLVAASELEADGARILQGEAANLLAQKAEWQPAEGFDVVFLDPPYHKGLVTTTVTQLLAANLLRPGASLYIEAELEWAALTLPESIQPIKSTRAGLVNAYLARYAPTGGGVRSRYEPRLHLPDSSIVHFPPGMVAAQSACPNAVLHLFSGGRLCCCGSARKLRLPDGDFLDIDWHLPAGWAGDAPLVLVVHGLSGSSESHYVVGLQAALAARGWASVAMNCRGASGRPNNRLRAYHAGASDDILAVLQHMASIHPQAPRALVGYSLGGSMALTSDGAAAGRSPRVCGGRRFGAFALAALCQSNGSRLFQGLSAAFHGDVSSLCGTKKLGIWPAWAIMSPLIMCSSNWRAGPSILSGSTTMS
jgi:predicted alpha/beta hydrolase